MFNAHTPRPCRFCGQALNAIERVQGDSCQRLDCRRAVTTERAAAAMAADLLARRQAASKALQHAGPLRAPVIRLETHAARLARVRATERRAHRAHLCALAAGEAAEPGTPEERPVPSAPVPALPGTSTLTDRLCGFCAGRCCRHGAFTHAFIDRALLQRWVAARPGSGLQDAAADYAARLPAVHVEGSCLHHGSSGCTLPRAMRSDICNRYACDGLVQARQHVAHGAPHGLLATMPAAERIQRAAWLAETATHLLPPRRPRRR